MDNPYHAHVEACLAKIRREKEEEVTVVLKGKHLQKIRAMIHIGITCGIDEEETRLCQEIDQIMWEAGQKI